MLRPGAFVKPRRSAATVKGALVDLWRYLKGTTVVQVTGRAA